MSVQLPDVVIGVVVALAAYGLAPVYYDVIGLVTTSADPLTELMLELVVPFIFVGIVISVGVSARRADA